MTGVLDAVMAPRDLRGRCGVRSDEDTVIWIGADVLDLPFVRELTVPLRNRRRPPAKSDRPRGRIVGWSLLPPKAPADPLGFFSRRIFYLTPGDEAPGAQRPGQAVDPSAVVPGRTGRI